MATKTSLQLTSRFGVGGADIVTNISHANPEATDATLLSFAKSLNSLTQNTYVSTKRINAISLDDDDDGGEG